LEEKMLGRHSRQRLLVPRRRLTLAAAAAISAWATQSPAANYTWVGTTNTTWSTGTNWTPGGPPGASDEAIFNTVTTNQPSLTAAASIGELDFTAGGWTIGGSQTLTLNGIGGIGILDTAGTGTDTIADKVAIGTNAQSWDISTGGTFTISGVISGSGALTIGDTSGTYGGTLIFSGANTLTSAITVDSGTLELSGSGTINTASSLALAGGNLLLNATTTVSPAINLTSNAAISANSGDTGTISGAIAGSTNLTFGAASGNTGTINLTNANSGYTGAVTVAYGTLGLTGSGSLNGANSITVNSGATLNYNQTATEIVPITDNGTVSISGGSVTFSGNGAIVDNGSLNVTGGTATFSANATIADNGSITTSAIVNFNTSISGGGSITVNGGGDTFSAANSVSGPLNINAGSVTLSGAGTLSNIGTITLDNTASLQIINTTAAGGNVNNRLNSGTSINSYGGTIAFTGSDASSSNDGVSAIDLFGSVITAVTVNANGNPASFELNNLQRNNGTGSTTGGGVLFVNGANLGSSSGAQIFVNNGTQLSGTTPGSATDKGGSSALNQQIVPFVVGESATSSGGGGTVTGTPNTFVAAYPTTDSNVNTVYGLRPLNPTDEFTNNSIVSGNNTYITAATTASATNSINSLVINGGDLSIANGATLTNTSGALLFVSSNSIKPSGTTGTLDFGGNEAVITVDNGVTGTISAPVTGSNALTVNGIGAVTTTGTPGTTGTLALTTSSAFSGNAYVNDATLQLGNGTSASADAALANVTGYFINNGGTLNFDYVNPQTITAPITELQSTPGGNGSAILLVSGPGGVNFNDTITRQNAGFAYIESQNTGPVSFTGSFNVGNMRLYPGGANEGGALVGSYSNQETWSVTNNGSIGTSGQPAGTLYVSNTNFGTNVTPSPVTFNVTSTGSIYANSLYLGYNGGALTTNVNGPVTLTASLFGAFNAGVANNNSTVYQTLNVGSGGLLSANNAYLAYSASQFSYLNVNNGGQFTVQNPTATSTSLAFYGANLGDGLVEVGALNTGSAGTINFGNNYTGSSMPGIIFNGGTTSSGAHTPNEFSELNIYAGGSVNIGIQPAAGVSQFSGGGSGGINAGYVAGQTFVLNVQGGTLNNFTGNGPVYVAQNLAAGFTAYSIINVNSDANGNVGKLITAYLRALPNPTNGSASANGVTGAFLNFNGGEVEYNNLTAAGAIPGPGNGIPNNGWVGGVFVFPKGAIMGTNALESIGAAPPSGTSNVDHPLMAPLGNGVTTIPITNGGSGYLSPPMVQITDSTGIDASAVATLTNGVVTAITITSPGINYAAPTITFIGGDPTTPATVGTPTVATNATTGGFTKVDNGTLIAQGGYWYPNPGQNPATVADLQAAQNTYGGPTTVVAGTLQLNGLYNATNNVIIETNTSTDAAILQINQPTSLNSVTATTTPVAWIQNNNNVPLAAAIVVGDQPANATLTNVGTLQISTTGKGGVSGFALAANQVLAGFGNVQGTSTFGLNIGQAPSGAVAGAITSNVVPNPTTPTALTGTNSVVSPGYTSSGTALVLLNNTNQYQPSNPQYGPIIVGTSGSGTNTVTFNTKLGNAASLGAPAATGALTLGNNTSMTTTLGGAGTYYWKLDLTNGGAGATTTPGTATVSPGLGGAINAGAGWDQLIIDGLALNSTVGTTASGSTNAFTVQATSFSSNVPNGGSSIPITGGTMPATSYSWVITRVNQAFNPATAQGFLASLSLDTSGLPKTASGYQYFLTTQPDPSAGDTDLVVNYAPAPEPGSCLLLGLGAGAMLRRRRRNRMQG
jgi:fibronectin-binding autotransporter adhesin